MREVTKAFEDDLSRRGAYTPAAIGVDLAIGPYRCAVLVDDELWEWDAAKGEWVRLT